jgi:hypothetical protein
VTSMVRPRSCLAAVFERSLNPIVRVIVAE